MGGIRFGVSVSKDAACLFLQGFLKRNEMETKWIRMKTVLEASSTECRECRAAIVQDADVFAYLCERPPNGGDLVYVTEGSSWFDLDFLAGWATRGRRTIGKLLPLDSKPLLNHL